MIEVRYENLSVEGDAYVGDRALPSLYNAIFNSIESTLQLIGLCFSKKRKVKILQSITAIIKPSRMTLLLGPPGAGKTTLLLALAAFKEIYRGIAHASFVVSFFTPLMPLLIEGICNTNRSDEGQ
ncbi:hypothetical protein L6452_09098 [Arctium lappa]|uniref:Uncharacterized protein n=1 Tax=Arctium lappa TaxID=4217 RepID=A0ACB9DJ47_ARCLA|nr:hypothetical protein L6452_09098 [Arctium lappa]